MKNSFNYKAVAVGIFATASLGATAHAQSADALVDKLVEKGILTVKEAKDLREETDKDFDRAYKAKSGMPDWVTSLKISGDVRLRYDGIYFDPESGGPTGVDRNRIRHRTRVGITASLLDDFEVGVRLASAEAKGPGGFADPISGNDSFTGNAGRKPVWFDLMYVKWTAVNTPTWSATFLGGKMDNPFTFDEVVFDPDYAPEGLAWQTGYNLNDKHGLKFNAGLFSLSEVSGSSHDSYLFGAQLRWDAAWTPKWATTVGLSGLAISDKDSLAHLAASSPTGGTVPDVSKGNTRASSTAAPTSDFNPFVIDAALTYTMESFPKYPGAFPVKLMGEYINNPAASANPAGPLAPGLKRNEAYSIGMTLGKSGKKGTWDLTYKWKNLESNYWFEEMVDSDHGAWYQTSPFTGGGGTGYGAGTNLRGHYMRAAYSPTDSLTLSCTYYLFSLIDKPAGALSSQTGRIQIDAAWKF